MLASKLQQWNLLQHSVKVTTFRTRNQEFEQFFKTVGYFTYCKDIDGLMDVMHMRHGPEQWRLFIDDSKTSLGPQIRQPFKDQQFEATH
jgi:hypothetical protein